MQNNDAFVNNKYLTYMTSLLEEYFHKDVRLTSSWFSNDAAGMGAFYLEYQHLPTSFTLIIDCQMLTFTISLKDENENIIDLITLCDTVLKSRYGKKWGDTELTFKNIKRAVKELSRVLNHKANYIFS